MDVGLDPAMPTFVGVGVCWWTTPCARRRGSCYPFVREVTAMNTPTLETSKRARVIRAIDRALREACPQAFAAGETDRPGGLADLYAHVGALVQIVRRSTTHRLEPYLAEILEDVCANCAHQDASGFCPLRQGGTCVLYANAGVVVEAIAGALREMHDEPYQAVHAPAEAPSWTAPAPAEAPATAAEKAVPFRRILIAADTDDSSRAAIALGLELAARVDAQVALAHVLPPLAGHMAEPTEASRRTHDEDRDRAGRMFRRIRQMSGLPVAAEFLLQGYPGAEIVEVARRWKADLIVVGTHGSGRLTSFLLGSTTQAVIRDAPCPVLVVRPQPESHAASSN
jgi:nucleotide-binding universal stress UspA family protein